MLARALLARSAPGPRRPLRRRAGPGRAPGQPAGLAAARDQAGRADDVRVRSGRTTFTVVERRRHGSSCAARCRARPVGSWSSRFPDVYRIDLSALRSPGPLPDPDLRRGPHHVAVLPDRRAPASSTARWSATASRFDQAQRDGAQQVPGPLDRQPAHLNDAAGRRLRLAAHGARRGPDHRPRPHQDRRPGRRRGRLGGRRRLPQVHPLHGLQRRRPVHQRPPARRQGAADAAARGAARPGLAGQDVGRADRHPAPPGRHRLGQRAGHLRRRPRPVAAAPGRRPRHRPAAPVRRAPAGLRRGARRPADQPQPRRPGLGGVRARRPARARPGHGPRASCGKAQALYARADTTTPPRPLVTALPHAFYPESVWQDDMELGAAEIARAAQRLGEPAAAYLADAAHWAKALPEGPLDRHPQPVRRRRARPRQPGRRDARGAARQRWRSAGGS